MTNAAIQLDPAPRIAIIGGTNTGAFRRHLEGWGLVVGTEIPFLPLRVPKDTTSLVVLKTHCSHKLFNAAQKYAERKGIPLVAVEQSWSQALPLLQQAGIVPKITAVTPPPEAPAAPASPAQDMVYRMQSRLVRLGDQISQAEDLILQRDDLILQMSQRLDDMAVRLSEINVTTPPQPMPMAAVSPRLNVERITLPWQDGEVWKSSTGLAHRITTTDYGYLAPACGVRWGSTSFLTPRNFLWTRSTGEPTCFQCCNRGAQK